MKKLYFLISIIILAAFVLGACQPAATEAPEPTKPPPPPEAPMEEHTEAPT